MWPETPEGKLKKKSRSSNHAFKFHCTTMFYCWDTGFHFLSLILTHTSRWKYWRNKSTFSKTVYFRTVLSNIFLLYTWLLWNFFSHSCFTYLCLISFNIFSLLIYLFVCFSPHPFCVSNKMAEFWICSTKRHEKQFVHISLGKILTDNSAYRRPTGLMTNDI